MLCLKEDGYRISCLCQRVNSSPRSVQRLASFLTALSLSCSGPNLTSKTKFSKASLARKVPSIPYLLMPSDKIPT